VLNSMSHKSVTILLAGLVCASFGPVSRAGGPIHFSGAIAGVVRDLDGVPRMGASVTLLNPQERSIGRVRTDEHGRFELTGLAPALYSVRVTLASFDPAVRRNLLVQPGMRSLLNVSLSTVFSSIQLAVPPLENGNVMSEDWKWVLRTASDARPITRFTDSPAPSQSTRSTGEVVSETRGVVRLSAGDSGLLAGVGDQADLGTAFALSTILSETSSIQVSGNLGYGSQTGIPATALRASYSRELGGGQPEVTLTLRQLYIPGRTTAVPESSVPMLRTVSGQIHDSVTIADAVTLAYGSGVDSISFLGNATYYSPFVQIRYAIDRNSNFAVAFSSGNAAPGLDERGGEADTASIGSADLERDLDSLSMFPRLSEVNGHARVQRGQEYEIAYQRRMGSRRIRASAYRQVVSDAAITMVDPSGAFSGSADVLPELFSNNSVLNAGNFAISGYDLAATQDLGSHLSATAIYGSDGGLTAVNRGIDSNDPDELRSMIRSGRRHAATARVAAILPRIGTRLIASYQWSGDQRWVMAGNLYSMLAIRTLPGFNVEIRQPLPGFHGRVEAVADLRNLLAQGYLPLMMSGGQQVLLVDSPRSFRGGLAFTF
jgi:hypothetical protein